MVYRREVAVEYFKEWRLYEVLPTLRVLGVRTGDHITRLAILSYSHYPLIALTFGLAQDGRSATYDRLRRALHAWVRPGGILPSGPQIPDDYNGRVPVGDKGSDEDEESDDDEENEAEMEIRRREDSAGPSGQHCVTRKGVEQSADTAGDLSS